MGKVREIKKIIEDLEEYRCTLEPFSRASINTHNEILRFKKLYPCDPTSIDIIEILVVSYVNVGMQLRDIIEIFDALEDTEKFLYSERIVTNLYNKITQDTIHND